MSFPIKDEQNQKLRTPRNANFRLLEKYYTAKRSKSQYRNLRFDIILLHIVNNGENMIYKRIRDLREDKDYTQKRVAAYLNCSQQVYSNYELGQRDIPTAVLIKLSRLYNTSVDYLLGETDIPARYKK